MSHYRPASVSLAGGLWPNTECWLVSFVVLQGIGTNIAKRPYIFVILQCVCVGGGGGFRTPCPPLDPHMYKGLIKFFEECELVKILKFIKS